MAAVTDSSLLACELESPASYSNEQKLTSNNKVSEKRDQRRSKITNVDGQRNRRMLANIQAALGGTTDNIKIRKPRIQTKNDEFVFQNLSEVLERIRLADTDVQVSLSDIRPYLLAHEKSMSKDELQVLCLTFCKSALSQSNSYYIVGLCVDLINNRDFVVEMANNLRHTITNFLAEDIDDNSDIKALPDFLAQLATAKWPRGRDKAIENLNPILYTVISTVMGWIQYITECTEKDEDEVSYNTDLVVKCTEALCTFCMIGQRSLWLSFPDIFDNVYEASKSILTSNLKLTRSLKSSLLHLHLLLNKWSVSNTRKYSSAATQTIFRI